MWRGVLIGLTASVLVGCSSNNETVDIEPLTDEPGLPLYYAGESFAGLPLTHAEGYGPTGRALFVYGTCEPGRGVDEGGCAPPVSIESSEFQRVHWVVEHRCLDGRDLRGVPAAFANGLVLFTGDLRLKIHARTAAEALAVVRALRGVNTSTAPSDPLPPQTRRARRLAAAACA